MTEKRELSESSKKLMEKIVLALVATISFSIIVIVIIGLAVYTSWAIDKLVGG